MQRYLSVRTPIFLGGAILLGLSFNYPFLWPLGLLGLVPLFVLVFERKCGLWKTFFLGWLFGFIYIGGVLIWFWHSLPLDWLGIESARFSVLLVFIYWGSTVLVLSFFVGLFAACTRLLPSHSLISALLAPLLFVCFEYLRLWGFAFQTYGEGVDFGAHFTFGFLGYLLAEHSSLLQLASVGEVYLLSLIVAFISTVLAVLYVYRDSLGKRRAFWLASGLMSVLFFTSFIPTSILDEGAGKNKTLNVALVSTYVSPTSVNDSEESRVHFEMLLTFVKESIAIGADIIVLPEDVRFLKTSKTQFTDSFSEFDFLLVDAERFATSEGVYGTAVLHDFHDDSSQRVKKQHLVPQGEYTPFLYGHLLRFLGHDRLVQKLVASRGYRSGVSEPVRAQGISFGIRFCTEITSPLLFKELRNAGADIFLSLSSQSWFHSSRILHNQTISIAQVRAAANGRYILQSANGSPAFVVSDKGQLVAESMWGGDGFLLQRISLP